MADQSSPGSDAALALLRALVDEIKSLAHDPATVHLIAEKMKHGIDVLEKAITEEPPKQKQEQK